MFKFACHRYCRVCGGTNLWFVSQMGRKRNGEPRVHDLNTCKECYNEYRRKRTAAGYWRTDKIRALHQAYRDRTKDKRKIWNAEYKAKRKQKEKRMIVMEPPEQDLL